MNISSTSGQLGKYSARLCSALDHQQQQQENYCLFAVANSSCEYISLKWGHTRILFLWDERMQETLQWTEATWRLCTERLRTLRCPLVGYLSRSVREVICPLGNSNKGNIDFCSGGPLNPQRNLYFFHLLTLFTETDPKYLSDRIAPIYNHININWVYDQGTSKPFTDSGVARSGKLCWVWCDRVKWSVTSLTDFLSYLSVVIQRLNVETFSKGNSTGDDVSG